MQVPDDTQLLKFLQSGGKISQSKAVEIAAYFDQMELQKNEFLLREGQVSNSYLVINFGFMRAYSIDLDGDEVTTAFYTDGGYPVFDVASFFNRTPSRENIQALVPTTGWSISFENLNFIFHAIPEFREFGRSILVRGYASLKARMLSMITETAEERYRSLLDIHPEIFQQAPLKQIASYLGITDSSLSRIRKEFMMK